MNTYNKSQNYVDRIALKESLIQESCSSGERVIWIAWESDGRGYVFKAPKIWSKDKACKFAECLYNSIYVTVEQL